MNAVRIIGVDRTRGDSVHVAQIGRGDRILATLYCGDAYTIRPSLGFMDADVMDPPYLIATSGGGLFRKSRTTMDEIADLGIDQGFDLSIINPLLCGAAVVFCHNDQLPDLLQDMRGNFERFALCDWYKPSPMPVANKHYVPDREFPFTPGAAAIIRKATSPTRGAALRRVLTGDCGRPSVIRPSSRPRSWRR